MLQICGIKACDSMKKAFARLDAAGVAYAFQDFKKMPPTAEQIAFWLSKLPAEALINRQGTTWRQLAAEEQAMLTNNQALTTLLITRPSLIKRPLLISGEQVTTGLASALLPTQVQ
ncbi:MAG: ArsC/Spx/MgsR family protein [Pseudomonadota bacterium]